MNKPTLYEIEVKTHGDWHYYGSRDNIRDVTALKQILERRGHRTRVIEHSVTRRVLGDFDLLSYDPSKD